MKKLNLVEQVAAMQLRAQAKNNENAEQQLPLWSEAMRCMPNEILKSALFNAKNRNHPRAYLKKQEIAVLFDGRITYQGEELRQDDETVWFQLVHLARIQPLGSIVEFTPYSFCKSIGWPICKGSYVRLRECLDRMQASALSVYSSRLGEGVSLSMLPMFAWQDENKNTLKKYKVQIAPKLVDLFGSNCYSRLEWQQRLSLPVGLATWLHGYYASHKEPYPIKIETIKRGSGMSCASQSKVQQLVQNALNELVKVNFLSSWAIEKELVHVKRAQLTQ